MLPNRDEQSLRAGGAVPFLLAGACLLAIAGIGTRIIANRRSAPSLTATAPPNVEWPPRPVLGDGIERYFERVEQLGQVTRSRTIGELDHEMAISSALFPAHAEPATNDS
jgi:hypothetical protein